MFLLLLLMILPLPAQNLQIHTGDIFALNVHLVVTSGTVTAVEWKASSGFAMPTLVKTISSGTLDCKGNNKLNCSITGLALSNWNDKVAQYTFRCPTTPGTYTITTQSKTIHGTTSASMDLRSGVVLTITPGAVDYKNGVFTVTKAVSDPIVLGFTAPSNTFTVRVQ